MFVYTHAGSLFKGIVEAMLLAVLSGFVLVMTVQALQSIAPELISLVVAIAAVSVFFSFSLYGEKGLTFAADHTKRIDVLTSKAKELQGDNTSREEMSIWPYRFTFQVNGGHKQLAN